MLRSKFMYQLPSCPCFLHVCPQSAAEATRHALKCAPGPAAGPFQSSHIWAPSSHTWAHAAAVADHCIYSCFWSNLLLFIFVSLLVYNVLLMLLSSEAQLLRNWPNFHCHGCSYLPSYLFYCSQKCCCYCWLQEQLSITLAFGSQPNCPAGHAAHKMVLAASAAFCAFGQFVSFRFCSGRIHEMGERRSE